ncbi:MAG TPA: tetratricopeptide repeat protein [Polyangiales bacterium]|jgi:tetratricopeptide (TPR) repeat protein|nr:tetratricopeptide repeat protein [Polyangiales bacterium]
MKSSLAARALAALIGCSFAAWIGHAQAQAHADADAEGSETSAPAPNAAASVSEADAADTLARKVYAQAKAAYDVGNYREALQYFQQAYELSGRSQLLYSIGQTADRLRLDETALKAFKLYLERVPNADNRQEVEQRVSVLEDVVAAKQHQAADAAALAPEAAARSTQSPSDVALDANPSDDAHKDNLLKKWWVWAGAGAVVVAVVVTVAVASGGSDTKTREPFAGSSGKVIAALELGP